MRLKGRQARFLLAIGMSWAGARAYVLWPESVASGKQALREATAAPLKQPASSADAPFLPPVRAELVEALSFSRPSVREDRRVLRHARSERTAPIFPGRGRGPDVESIALAALDPGFRRGREKEVIETSAPSLAVHPTPSAHSIEAQAYLFLRGGRQAALGQGELGGSQIAARLAWPASPHLALAARIYAPIRAKGAEASLGIDLHPFPALPLRLSVERRQRIDAEGRSAWSAYAAGGFYRGGAPGHAEFDGYAQAGIVGTQRRDVFIDGALGIGYRLPARRIAPIIGAGLWAAAQPGVARIDIGPRAALRLPIEGHRISAALTIATDF